jgi:Na+-driven multidrug efflux pump
MKLPRAVLRPLPLIVLLAFAATTAAACPICFQANQKSRKAYYATTGAMLLLPPVLVGGFTVWYQRRARQLPGEDDLPGR